MCECSWGACSAPEAWGGLTTLVHPDCPPLAGSCGLPCPGPPVDNRNDPHADAWWTALRSPGGNTWRRGLINQQVPRRGRGWWVPRGFWLPSATALAWVSGHPQFLKMGLRPEHLSEVHRMPGCDFAGGKDGPLGYTTQ